jgi:hypothetical protein
MEQVTIDTPVSGTYTVDISGFSIPQGPQTYYVVYEFVTDDVVLTYPIGGEGFDSSVDEKIRWDAFGNSGTFTLEYSDNNGSTWNTIASGIGASVRSYDWNVPAIVTGQALVKVTRATSSSQSHVPFSIIGVPTGLTVNWACPDSMEVSWNAVSGATAYEVSLLGNKYMDSVGTSSVTTLIIAAPANVNHWWSVKALSSNNCVGRRAYAKYQSSGTFNCTINIDAALSAIGPADEGSLLSCMNPNDLDVNITIQNDGVTSISNVPVHYKLNGGTTINEIYSGTLSPGASFNYTFTNQVSAVNGANTLVVWSDLSGDGNIYNDTVTSQFNYNNSTAKTLPWTEDFESFSLCGTASDCEMEVCATTNDFINETNGSIDDIDWRTNQGSTPSNSTGPSQDFNPGTSTGNYLYLEASGGCDGLQANLFSPCIDLTNATAAQLDFAYNMNGADMGSLHVDIYVNGAWTNDITTQINGNQGTSWLQRSVPLSSYLGNVVNFRFRGITGTGYRSDVAIDDINVSGTVGLDNYITGLDFIIHPNPSNGIFNYQYNGLENLTIEVMDITGKVIYTKTLDGNQNSNGVIDITQYANGLYLVALTTNSNRVIKKIVKQ